MNTIDVMKQARDALDSSQGYVEASSNAKLKDGWGDQLDKAEKAIADLEQAIQQEEANIQTQITKDILRPVKTYSGGKAWPVQTEWVGLTDYEIGVCSTEAAMNRSEMVGGAVTFARSIEAKLKEKNSKG
jgi:hypothetical protein